MTKDDLEGLRHSVNAIKYNFYHTDSESSTSEVVVGTQIKDFLQSPRLPDTFIGETSLKRKKQFYQPKVEHMIESSDGSNNLEVYDKIYHDLRDKLPAFTNLPDEFEDMSNA